MRFLVQVKVMHAWKNVDRRLPITLDVWFFFFLFLQRRVKVTWARYLVATSVNFMSCKYVRRRSYNFYVTISESFDVAKIGSVWYNVSLIFFVDRETQVRVLHFITASKGQKCHQIVTTTVKYEVPGCKAGLRYAAIIHFNCGLYPLLFERLRKWKCPEAAHRFSVSKLRLSWRL